MSAVARATSSSNQAADGNGAAIGAIRPPPPPSPGHALDDGVGEVEPTPPVEAGMVAALQVVPDDLAAQDVAGLGPERAGRLHAAGGQDGGRLDDLRRGEDHGDHLLALVEVVVEVRGHRRVLGQAVAQVHGAVGHVPGLVLHAQPEDLLFDGRRRQGGTGPEERQHDALTQQVHEAPTLVVGLGVEDQLQEPLDHGRRPAQAAAVGQRPLAEDLGVPGLVHHLGAEEHLGFDEVVVDAPQPLGREVGGNHLHLGQHRGQLAHGVLDVGVERHQLAPGDVPGGAPLAADRLLVEVERRCPTRPRPCR